MRWTEELLATAIRLKDAGLSANEIAAELGGGLTRNSVIGKLHRSGHVGGGAAPGQVHAVERRAAAGMPRKPSPAVRPDAATRPTAAPRRVTPYQVDPLAVFPLPHGGAVGASDAVNGLAPGDCRWPLGDPLAPDFRFCCAPAVENRPYCGHHGVESVDKKSTAISTRRAFNAYANANRRPPPQGKFQP
jgi:GcrA cell cycle regulator